MQAMQNFPPPDESMKSREPGDDDAGLPAGTEQSDLDLVRRAQQNERGAFDLLVLKYQHKVIKLVARLLRDPTEAEDVAQEAFVKAYRALGSFRGDRAPARRPAHGHRAARNRGPQLRRNRGGNGLSGGHRAVAYLPCP